MRFYEEDSSEGAPEWIVTFADLMSLLLTFFVLLLSMSSIQVERFRQAVGSIKTAFGTRSDFSLSDSPSGERIVTALDAEQAERRGSNETPEQMEERLHGLLEQTGLEHQGQARLTKHGVVLQLNGDLLFESGESAINPAALAVLDGLADYIATVDRSIDIIGHTDDVPISTPLYPSNWELPAARAAQAVRYMVEQGARPSQLRAIGQAETVPLVPNDSADNRAKNRRVEFVFTAREEGVQPAQPAAIESLPEPVLP